MELPRKISFDFLSVLFGILLMAFPFYPSFIHVEIQFNMIVFGVGAYFLIMGLSLIKYYYDLDMRLKEFEHTKQINEYLKYFDKEKLINKKTKETLLKDIKDFVKQN